MTTTYVVTGGTGFLGTHLVQHLCQQPHVVIKVLCRKIPKIQQQCQGVEYIPCDIRDPHVIAFHAQGAAGVFHLAGAVQHSRQAVQAMQDANVMLTHSVMQGAVMAAVPRVVYASTSGVVAVTDTPPTSTAGVGEDAPYATRITARWPYYAAKIQAEQYARKHAADNNMQLVCMRPTLLLGPGDTNLSSCGTVVSLLQGTVPLVPHGGVSMVDVRDAAQAFVAAMQQQGAAGKTYLLTGANMPCAAYFELVGDVAGVRPPCMQLPRWLMWVAATLLWRAKALLTGCWDPTLDPVLVEMGNVWWYADSSAATRDLGFAPRNVRETLEDTVMWLKSHMDV